MTFPSLDIEKELWSQGYSHIAGVDEVGRGAWAGPVVAAAVIFPQDFEVSSGLRDSKLLTPRKREELDGQIREAAVSFSVGEVPSSVIEQKGIAVASEMAMRKAVRALDPQADFLLIDYFHLKYIERSRQQAIKKGDVYCVSIAAASIIAKVYRDQLMRGFDERREFEVYQFGKHKGYGTKLHQGAIRECGVSRIHRASFIPEQCLT